MSSKEIKVPDIGDFAEVTVIELMVKPGDTIKAEQSIITVESDKASMEIPSSHAGVVKELKVALGDKVKEGSLVLLLEAADGAVMQPATAASATAVAAPTAVLAADAPVALISAAAVAEPAHNPTASAIGLSHASPSVRKFARELGVPLAEIKGSGPKGRITDLDIRSFTRSIMSGVTQTTAAAQSKSAGAALGLLPWPVVDFAKFGPIERKDRARIKKISAANLHRNWVMIPHVTNHDDADITISIIEGTA